MQIKLVIDIEEATSDNVDFVLEQLSVTLQNLTNGTKLKAVGDMQIGFDPECDTISADIKDRIAEHTTLYDPKDVETSRKWKLLKAKQDMKRKTPSTTERNKE